MKVFCNFAGMKKVTLIILIFLAINNPGNAQEITQSNVLASFGYGWPNWTTVLTSIGNEGKISTTGPFHFKLEYRPVDIFSLSLSSNYNYVSITTLYPFTTNHGMPAAYTSIESR